MNRLLTIILLSAAMCGMSTVCEAQEQVDVNIYDPYGEFPVHRTPMLLPTVYIDGFTLSFEDLWGEYELQILQGGTVVYTTMVYPAMTYVNLPTTLSGAYEFRLVADTYYYYGFIDL